MIPSATLPVPGQIHEQYSCTSQRTTYDQVRFFYIISGHYHRSRENPEMERDGMIV